MKRAVVLILDGLGVGAMPDVAATRPEDIGSHTLAHILAESPVELPVLTGLGLGNILNHPELLPVSKPEASYGTCNLSHYGADTYAGHNEIMGSSPKIPVKQWMLDTCEEIAAALRVVGYDVEYPIAHTGLLLVGGKIVVADNMETDPGQIINVTGPLDVVPFEDIVAVGEVVRQVVKTSRVISLGGTDITTADILNSCIGRDRLYGVDTPKLKIYNELYRVRHLGFGINPETQVPALFKRSDIPVYLYGKIADVIQGDAEERDPVVPTPDVFGKVLGRLEVLKHGLICATVQETDLAGHEQDSEKYAAILRLSDKGIGQIIEKLREGDLLIVTADHGNDPTIGHSRHTRECTPLLVYEKGSDRVKELGIRETLADVAATVCDFFGTGAPEHGNCVFDTVFR